jgi:aspartokinase
MYGVTKLSSDQDIMLITFRDAAYSPEGLARHLQVFADLGIVVDMISQSAPRGTNLDFSFTTDAANLPAVMKAIPALSAGGHPAPLISSGYSKINLYGEDMVTCCGVAARALRALAQAEIEIVLITTSDLDISLLIRSEAEDLASTVLRNAFAL